MPAEDPTKEHVDMPLPDDIPSVDEMAAELPHLDKIATSATVDTEEDKGKTPVARPTVVIPSVTHASHPSPDSPDDVDDDQMSILSGLNKHDAKLEELTIVIKELSKRVKTLDTLSTKVDALTVKANGLESSFDSHKTGQINIQRAFTAYQTKTSEAIAGLERMIRAKAQIDIPEDMAIDTAVIPPSIMEHESAIPKNTVPAAAMKAPSVKTKPVKKVNLSEWGL